MLSPLGFVSLQGRFRTLASLPEAARVQAACPSDGRCDATLPIERQYRRTGVVYDDGAGRSRRREVHRHFSVIHGDAERDQANPKGRLKDVRV